MFLYSSKLDLPSRRDLRGDLIVAFDPLRSPWKFLFEFLAKLRIRKIVERHVHELDARLLPIVFLDHISSEIKYRGLEPNTIRIIGPCFIDMSGLLVISPIGTDDKPLESLVPVERMAGFRIFGLEGAISSRRDSNSLTASASFTTDFPIREPSRRVDSQSCSHIPMKYCYISTSDRLSLMFMLLLPVFLDLQLAFFVRFLEVDVPFHFDIV